MRGTFVNIKKTVPRTNKPCQIINLLAILLAFLFINSCGLFDSGSDQIIRNYKIQWIDMLSARSICKTPERYPDLCETLVLEYVFAVGHNSDFIIAKQHPTSGFENGYKVNTTITNYFIIDIKTNVRDNRKRVIGPLTAKQFEQSTLDLNIGEIEFDQTYTENPY